MVSDFSFANIFKLASSLAYLKLLSNTDYLKVQVLVSSFVKQPNLLDFTDCMLVIFCLPIEMDMKFSCGESNFTYLSPHLEAFEDHLVYLDISIWVKYFYYQKRCFIIVRVSSSKR